MLGNGSTAIAAVRRLMQIFQRVGVAKNTLSDHSPLELSRVRRQVAVIAATGGEPSPLAARAATTSIPIVFTAGGDPIEAGLVASLNQPGGNVTDTTIMGIEMGSKRLDLVRQLVPSATSVAMLVNPKFPLGST
jgi:ABC-type uncharacterized transport system substrate-binding protein